MNDDLLDPSKEWNANVLRNLRFQYPDLAQVADITLLIRYDEWGMMGLTDAVEGMHEYLLTGE